jgi:hypothetical protein
VLFCLVGRQVDAQDAMDPPRGLVEEPDIVQRAVTFIDRRQGNVELASGVYLDFANMIPGAGWISAGPGYRRWYAQDRVILDTSAALSWRGYTIAQARIELPRMARSRLAVGSQARWQDFMQVNFFGQGADTLESTRSEYRLTSRNAVGYATLRLLESVAIEGSVGWLRPDISEPAGWFERDRPDTRDVFPSDVVFAIPDQPTFVHSEAAVTADTRDFWRHPTRGGLYRAAASNYAARNKLFSFRRYEAEAAHFVPVGGTHLVVALHQWLVASDTSAGQVVPFYLQPSLGGHNSLRAYSDYRFHDRNLIVVNAEGRIALMAHVDAALFVDAGNVAAVLADLNLDKRSYGAGVRLHTRRQTFARLDLAHGDEGWRLVVNLTDPLALSRLSRRTAAVPFVP